MERPDKLTQAGEPLECVDPVGWVSRRSSAIKRLRAVFVQFGPSLGALYLLNHALRRASGGCCQIVCYGLYAQPIAAGRYATVQSDNDTVVRAVKPGDALTAFFPRAAEVIEQRFKQGAQCRAATVKGRFGGFIWWSTDSHDEDEVRCRFLLPDSGDAVWDFDVYVEPAMRMGRMLGRMWKAVDAELYAEGVRWTFSRISKFNRASIAVHERLGAVAIGWAVYLCLGRLQLALMGSAPFFHLSWGSGTGPTLQLRAPSAVPAQDRVGPRSWR